MQSLSNRFSIGTYVVLFSMVQETCKLVEKYSHIASIRKGFLEAMDDRYTFDPEFIIWKILFSTLNN